MPGRGDPNADAQTRRTVYAGWGPCLGRGDALSGLAAGEGSPGPPPGGQAAGPGASAPVVRTDAGWGPFLGAIAVDRRRHHISVSVSRIGCYRASPRLRPSTAAGQATGDRRARTAHTFASFCRVWWDVAGQDHGSDRRQAPR